MKITLPSLMIVLLGAVCAQADVAVQPDFDLQKEIVKQAEDSKVQKDPQGHPMKWMGIDSGQKKGMWQILGGSSNCPVFQAMKEKMKTSAAIVTPLPDGDMKIVTGYPMPEECKKVEKVFKKTEHPGRFTHADDVAKRDVRVMQTDYTNFAILYTFKESEGEPSTTTLQLYTRGSDASPEVMEKFKQHCHNVGLTDDMMVMLPKSDECLKVLSA